MSNTTALVVVASLLFTWATLLIFKLTLSEVEFKFSVAFEREIAGRKVQSKFEFRKYSPYAPPKQEEPTVRNAPETPAGVKWRLVDRIVKLLRDNVLILEEEPFKTRISEEIAQILRQTKDDYVFVKFVLRVIAYYSKEVEKQVMFLLFGSRRNAKERRHDSGA